MGDDPLFSDRDVGVDGETVEELDRAIVHLDAVITSGLALALRELDDRH